MLPGAALLRSLPGRLTSLGQLSPLTSARDAAALRAAFTSAAVPRRAQVGQACQVYLNI